MVATMLIAKGFWKKSRMAKGQMITLVETMR
jgi:hypothetical protein